MSQIIIPKSLQTDSEKSGVKVVLGDVNLNSEFVKVEDVEDQIWDSAHKIPSLKAVNNLKLDIDSNIKINSDEVPALIETTDKLSKTTEQLSANVIQSIQTIEQLSSAMMVQINACGALLSCDLVKFRGISTTDPTSGICTINGIKYGIEDFNNGDVVYYHTTIPRSDNNLYQKAVLFAYVFANGSFDATPNGLAIEESAFKKFGYAFYDNLSTLIYDDMVADYAAIQNTKISGLFTVPPVYQDGTIIQGNVDDGTLKRDLELLSGYCDMLSSESNSHVKSVNNIKPDENGNINIEITKESFEKLPVERLIKLNGDVIGSTKFDGSKDVSINAIVKDDSHNHNINTINGLGNLASKNTILSSDISDQLQITQIYNLQNSLDSKISSVNVATYIPSYDGTKLATITVNGKPFDIYGGTGTVTNIQTVNGIASIGIGSIIAFAGTTNDIPANALLCDGREIKKSDYQDLYTVIGDTFGSSSSSEYFKLPNLNDKFIEGCNSYQDTGTIIEAGLPNINGFFNAVESNGSIICDGAFSKDTDYDIAVPRYSGHGSLRGDIIDFDASKSNSIYKDNCNTVQPPAIKMRYVIIFKTLETDIVNSLKKLAYKDKVGDNDISGYLPISKIDNLQTNLNTLQNNINAKSKVSITQTVTSGQEIAKITIDGNTRSIYSPTVNTNTNPQVAFPDWDESKAISINSGHVVQNDGFLMVHPKSGSDRIGAIYINDVEVGSVRHSSTVGCADHITQILVSKGDVITFQYPSIIDIAKIYPAKSVSQPDCASYVIETNRGTNVNGSTQWYRLYSDGWCEQGGYITDVKFNPNTEYDIKLAKTYQNAYYNINFSIQVPDSQTIGMINCYSKKKRTNSFCIYTDFASIGNDGFNGGVINWETKGYIK